MNSQSAIISSRLAAAAFAAIVPAFAYAGTSQNAGPTRQGAQDAITISFSGQVALKGFLTSPGISTLRPGGSITLTYPSGPVTYTATNTPTTLVQLAKPNFLTSDTGIDYSGGVPDVQQHSALRLEWHEQGSAEGLIDLINDQVGYTTGPGGTGILSNVASRGPSTSNPTWVNGTAFIAGNTLNGHTLAAGNFGDTYDAAVYNRATGRNLQGGQNRVQFSIGEYKTESFARSGTAAVGLTPGSAGYGQGNTAYKSGANANGLGIGGARQSYRADTVVNLSANKVNPESPTNQTYAAGPWDSAGADNIDSRQIAVTAVPFVANPGTGLKRLNLGDTQWLQTLGRLQNGADFNVVTRSADTGQRIVAALNTGIDPSWSLGENDDGNTSGSAAAATQRSIGSGIRFSGKTSGSEARNAIAQSRLGFGPLSLAEVRAAASAAPIRTLDVTFANQTDPNTNNGTDYSAFKQVNFDNIVNFEYRTVLISHFNTIKAPNTSLLTTFRNNFQTANGRQPTSGEEVAWWSNLSSTVTGIKGDPNGNVAAFIDNIAQSVGSAATGLTPASVNNPADALFINGYLIPQLLNFSREVDGGALTPNNLSPAQLAIQADIKANYAPAFTPDGTAGSRTQTIGNAATYGVLNAVSAPVINGAIAITAKDAAGNSVGNGVDGPRGNYLFGNFNQTGTRDYAAVVESVNAAISLAKIDLVSNGKSSIYTVDGGVANNTVIPSNVGTPGWTTSANTKGDLVVLGDFNSDGAFNGKDVYLLARGASLADSAVAPGLSTASGPNFADQLRNPNAVLRKNAALDSAQSQTNAVGGNPDGANAARAFLRVSGRTELVGTTLPVGATQLADLGGGIKRYTRDAAGDNTFNKFDVNRDGVVDFTDAAIVDSFGGKSFKSFTDQLSAVVATNQNDGGGAFVGTGNTLDPTLDTTTARRPFSLVDAELNDDANINAADLALINGNLSTGLTQSWLGGITQKTGLGTIAINANSATVDVAAGASLRIARGQVQLGGVADLLRDNTAAGSAVGTRLSVNIEAAGTLAVTAGTQSAQVIDGGGNVSVSAGATLDARRVLGNAVTVAGTLKLADSANGIIAGDVNGIGVNGGNGGTVGVGSTTIFGSLAIAGPVAAPTGTLDIRNNDAVIRNAGGSLDDVRAQVAFAYNGGLWDRAGITSSRAAADGLAVGFGANTDLGYATFSGVGANPSDLLVKYAWFGDANLDGQVDGDDYLLWLAVFGSSGNGIGWGQGDFDYDQEVDGDDYLLWLQNFGNGVGDPLSAVPEPGVLGLAAVAGLGMLGRRRRVR